MTPKPRVLIVDDEPAVLTAVARMVERLGYKAVSTLSGGEALKILEQEDIPLLLLDVILRDISVVELANRSHALRGLRKIVLMSGHFPQLEINLPRSMPFLQKPFTIDELKAALDRVQHAATPDRAEAS